MTAPLDGPFICRSLVLLSADHDPHLADAADSVTGSCLAVSEAGAVGLVVSAGGASAHSAPFAQSSRSEFDRSFRGSSPASLTATAAPGAVNLAWGASTDNVAVAGYRISRDGTALDTTYSLSYSDMTAAPGALHSYTVAAFDGAANASGPSNSASGTAEAAPVTPVAYTYDLADRLTSITTASGTSTVFTLDVLGRHASQTVGTNPTSNYSYLGSSNTVVAISAGSVTTLSAIDAIGDRVATSSGSSFGYLVPDLHGNQLAAIGSSGTSISDAFAYDAYGNLVASVTSSLPTPWRYQGRLLESAAGSPALYDFGARSYDPSLGVFTSLDSVSGSAQNPITLNRYLYANANPATMVDPDGHVALSCRYGREDCTAIRTKAVQVATDEQIEWRFQHHQATVVKGPAQVGLRTMDDVINDPQPPRNATPTAGPEAPPNACDYQPDHCIPGPETEGPNPLGTALGWVVDLASSVVFPQGMTSGVCFGISVGAIATEAQSICVVHTQDGHWGKIVNQYVGMTNGGALQVGVSNFKSNARSIQDLEGPFVVTGGSVGEVVYGSLTVATGKTPDGRIITVLEYSTGGGLNVGVPSGPGTVTTQTEVTVVTCADAKDFAAALLC